VPGPRTNRSHAALRVVKPQQQRKHSRLAGTRRHLKGDAEQVGVCGLVRIAERCLDPVVPVLAGNFGAVDRRFQRFDLAEEQLLLPIRPRPVFQQVPRDGRTRQPSPLAPQIDPVADEIDVVIFLGAILRPVRIEGELLSLLFRVGDGDEVAAFDLLRGLFRLRTDLAIRSDCIVQAAEQDGGRERRQHQVPVPLRRQLHREA